MSDDSDSDTTEKMSFILVKELLQASGLCSKKRKGKRDFLPHLYVIRNDKSGLVQSGEAMWYEYLSAIFRMLEDPALPQSWIPNIRKHLVDVTDMCSNWEWKM